MNKKAIFITSHQDTRRLERFIAKTIIDIKPKEIRGKAPKANIKLEFMDNLLITMQKTQRVKWTLISTPLIKAFCKILGLDYVQNKDFYKKYVN